MVTDKERQLLHQMLDRLCDSEETNGHIQWEAFFDSDVPFHYIRKMLDLGIRISEQDFEK